MKRYAVFVMRFALAPIIAGTFVIRTLEINGGLTLGLARTVHFTGAAALLAVGTMLAIQYRRRNHARPG